MADSEIREKTECSVVAIRADGGRTINPDPGRPIRAGSELILIGREAIGASYDSKLTTFT